MNAYLSKILVVVGICSSSLALADDFDLQPWNPGFKSVITINCQSYEDQKTRCYVPGTITHAQILNDYSGQCVFGKTFAWDNNYVLVTDGCSAKLRVTYNQNGNGGGGQQKDTVRCKSKHYNYNECSTDLDHIQSIKLLEQHSDADCVKGQTFGKSQNGRVWVNHGCEGTFRVTGH